MISAGRPADSPAGIINTSQKDGDVEHGLDYSIQCEGEEAAADAGGCQFHGDLLGRLNRHLIVGIHRDLHPLD